jgi:hypothetical protein
MSHIPERFNTERAGLCSALHWKSQYIWSAPDPTVPRSGDGLFWCAMTQTCIGPDGKLAEPGNCCSGERGCHCGASK